MPLVNFLKKISLLILRFSPEFWSSNIFAVTEHTRTKFFWRDIQKYFFFKKFTLVLLDGFLNGFSKFRFFIVKICVLIRDFWVIFENYSMCMLSIRILFYRTLSIWGNDFNWFFQKPRSAGGNNRNRKGIFRNSCRNPRRTSWEYSTLNRSYFNHRRYRIRNPSTRPAGKNQTGQSATKVPRQQHLTCPGHR